MKRVVSFQLLMTNFDPERENLLDLIEGVVAIFENLLSMTDSSLERFEKISKAKMDMRGMVEEISTTDATERNRDVVESAVRNFVERQEGRVQMTEPIVQQVIDYLCRIYGIPT